ncbi:MAG: single-stranded-DNA-specific exonuclease RecJ [Candidatus Brocadiia bacterium]
MTKVPPSAVWVIKHADFSARDLLVGELGISPFVATVLVNRGIREPDEVRRFLDPKLTHLHDPFLMKDMDAAVSRILKAAYSREKVVVFGDYDVDGIAAASLLRDFLRLAGLDCEVYIPDRITEGYGISPSAVDAYASRGYKLLITVDCGVRALAEIRQANELGMDVVVTDHHEAASELPPACAIVDPMRTDCSYPFKRLAGVGVAYKLAWALAVRLGGSPRIPEPYRQFLLDYLPLVALATICDVVPLLGENRVFVTHGLRAMTSSKIPGLKSLLEVSGVMAKISKGTGEINSRDIAYAVGPRINAAGRMGEARIGLELFSTDNSDRAREIALRLDELNKDRQAIEAEIFAEAREIVAAEAAASGEIPAAIVLARPSWHHGVIGIVASRLVGEFHRPTFLGCIEGETVRGSVRSVDGFDVVACLSKSEDILEKFGGHAGAAGFTGPVGSIEEFRRRTVEYCAAAFAENPRLLKSVTLIESELPFSAINDELIMQLNQLAPFGHEHPRPLFVATNVRVVGIPKLVGIANKHLSLHLNKDGTTFKGIAFNQGSSVDILKGPLSVLFHPVKDTYNGHTSLSLEVVAIKKLSDQ